MAAISATTWSQANKFCLVHLLCEHIFFFSNMRALVYWYRGLSTQICIVLSSKAFRRERLAKHLQISSSGGISSFLGTMVREGPRWKIILGNERNWTTASQQNKNDISISNLVLPFKDHLTNNKLISSNMIWQIERFRNRSAVTAILVFIPGSLRVMTQFRIRSTSSRKEQIAMRIVPRSKMNIEQELWTWSISFQTDWSTTATGGWTLTFGKRYHPQATSLFLTSNHWKLQCRTPNWFKFRLAPQSI